MERRREQPWDRKASFYKEQRQLDRGEKNKTNDKETWGIYFNGERKGQRNKEEEVESRSERADAATYY